MAVLSTALCAGFVLTSSAPATGAAVAQPAPVAATLDSNVDNVDTLSRGAVDREDAIATAPATTETAAATTAAPSPKVLYVTSVAYLRQQPNASAKVLATLAVGAQVTATGDAADGWQPVSSGSTVGFVKATLLSATGKAATTKTAGTSAAGAASSYPACASGSAVETGLAANTILVHRAVCNTYPSITAYGGLSGSGSEHSTGRALDIMVSGATGVEVAAWLKANYATFGIIEIIYQQKIWTTQRSSEGWRAMADRGSTTANHYDHIHVLVS
jgi:hypothetical protein